MDQRAYASTKEKIICATKMIISYYFSIMANLFSLKMNNLPQIFYQSLGTGIHQEKADRILEPMQVMIQLALLSFCPTGTKLCVNNNLLSLQLPTFSQGVWRWYNKDSKEDLFYLFNAVKRYYMWYKEQNDPVFLYVLQLSKNGMSKLIETYKRTDKTSIIHALTLYKSILEMNTADVFESDDKEEATIDDIFQKINTLYDEGTLSAISSILQLMEKEENEIFRKNYYDGIQLILTPLNHKIQEWIRVELLCS